MRISHNVPNLYNNKTNIMHYDININFSFFFITSRVKIVGTIKHGGVIGLWAAPAIGRKLGAKAGPPVMRHTGLGKLGGLINTAVSATKRSPGNKSNFYEFTLIK